MPRLEDVSELGPDRDDDEDGRVEGHPSPLASVLRCEKTDVDALDVTVVIPEVFDCESDAETMQAEQLQPQASPQQEQAPQEQADSDDDGAKQRALAAPKGGQVSDSEELLHADREEGRDVQSPHGDEATPVKSGEGRVVAHTADDVDIHSDSAQVTAGDGDHEGGVVASEPIAAENQSAGDVEDAAPTEQQPAPLVPEMDAAKGEGTEVSAVGAALPTKAASSDEPSRAKAREGNNSKCCASCAIQ